MLGLVPFDHRREARTDAVEYLRDLIRNSSSLFGQALSLSSLEDSPVDLPPFLLDRWIEQKHAPDSPIEYDLASSTGPVWTLRELLALSIR